MKHQTTSSKRPNGANANFLQRITFPVALPKEKLYLPNLMLQVRAVVITVAVAALQQPGPAVS